MATKQQKGSYLDRVRDKLTDKAQQGGKNRNDGIEFYPEIGSVKIRILPPISEEDLLPYYSHCYHFVPADINEIGTQNGSYLWAKKKYLVNGIQKQCPICHAVRQWYSVGRKNNNKTLLDMGGAMKLKRQYFFNVLLLDEPDPERKLRILVDTSNEGKLTRILCSIMGIPFFKDIEDNWVDEASKTIDPDKKYFDLVDTTYGHDFKIIKKKTGEAAWDFSYEDSFVIEPSRELTSDELKLIEKRSDLKTHIKYEEDYSKVKAIINEFVMDDEDDDGGTDQIPVKEVSKNIPIPEKKMTKTEVENEAELDDLLKELK